MYYAGNQLVQENDGSDNKLNTYYYYGPGGALASRVSNTNYKIYWGYDARGFLTHLSNGTGTVIEQYLYHSFGTPYIYNAAGTHSRGQTSGVLGGNRFLWAGGYEWYPEIGLYRCGARFYSPALGRFMQPDPIGQKGGLNIYSYCQNDPINKTDSSGLDGLNNNSAPVQSAGVDTYLSPDLGWAFGSTGLNNFTLPGTTSAVHSGSGSIFLGYVQYTPDNAEVTPEDSQQPSDKITITGTADVVTIYPPDNIVVPSDPLGMNDSPNVLLERGISFANPYHPATFYWREGPGTPAPSFWAASGSNFHLSSDSLMNDFFASPNASLFYKGSALDAQIYGGSAAYGNYVYGTYWGSAGGTLDWALSFANAIGLRASYSAYTPMSSTYPGLPVGNVQAITQGFNDALNGTIWTNPNPYNGN